MDSESQVQEAATKLVEACELALETWQYIQTSPVPLRERKRRVRRAIDRMKQALGVEDDT